MQYTESPKRPPNIFNHTYTWAKVWAMVYVIEILVLAFIGRKGLLLDIDFYGNVLFVSFLGVVVGFIINAIFNFRRAAFVYFLGHIFLILGLAYIITNSRKQENIRTGSGVYLPSPVDTVAAYRSMLNKMNEFYGEKNYSWVMISGEPYDSTDSRMVCYIKYTVNRETPIKFYIDKMYANDTDAKSLIHKVGEDDPIYPQLEQQMKSGLDSIPVEKYIKDIGQ